MTILSCATLQPLLERTVRDIAGIRDPFARHWLIFPGMGRSEWIQRRWSRIAGIASHSQIVQLRSLVEQVAASGKPVFSMDRLILAVAGSLSAVAKQLPLPKHTNVTVVNAQVLGWSRQLAEALDVGLLCRPGDDPWFAAPFLSSLARQPLVQEALAGHLGMMPAAAFAQAIATWCADWGRRGGIPRLWIHLDAGQPSILMQRITDLVRLLPDNIVHLSLLDPGELFWGDLRTGRRAWEDAEDAGPILRCLGRCAQDLHNQAIDLLLSEGSGEERIATVDLAPTVLGHLQACCRTAAAPDERMPLILNDHSVSVHDCRSPLRELEACRDRILQALSDDSSLKPDDILLLLADPARLAPLVGAALHPSGDGGVHLPYRLLGVGGAASSPVAEALDRLLHALRGRMDLTSVQRLIEDPIIAQRFGFDLAAEDGVSVVDWLKQAQFRWGLDATQRAVDQGDGEERWNLHFALRRLGLGAVADEAHRDGIVDGSAPLDRTSGLGIGTLASLAEFADFLKQAQAVWATDEARTMTVWCREFQTLCENFLGQGDRAASEQRATLINTLLPALERTSPSQVRLRADAAMRLVMAQAETLAEGHSSGGGGITVADLRQYAGTPARMILVVGLGTGEFPRREERPSWHPLSATRLLGDPDRRAVDRHALLLALLACGERLVLTYQGGSDEDDKAKPPSPPLADLLAAVDCVMSPGAGTVRPQDSIIFKHGLNGCSPQEFRADARPEARSFLTSDYLGAMQLIERHQRPYPGLWTRVLDEIDEATPITVSELFIFFTEPCKLFAQRLGLRTPDQEDDLPQGDLLEPGTLETWSLCDRLLRCRLQGADEAALRERLTISGDLPRGLYGDSIWKAVVDQTPRVANGPFTPWIPDLTRTVTGPEGQAWTITGRLPGGWYRNAAGSVHYYSASKLSEKHKLTLRLAVLLLAGTSDVREIIATYKEGRTLPMTVPTADEAQGYFDRFLKLFRLAVRLPLPWWPDSHDVLVKAMRRIEEGAIKDDTIEAALSKAYSTWSGEDQAEHRTPPPATLACTRMCFRGIDDPFQWTPAIDLPWLPEPERPLAWRMSRFLGA